MIKPKFKYQIILGVVSILGWCAFILLFEEVDYFYSYGISEIPQRIITEDTIKQWASLAGLLIGIISGILLIGNIITNTIIKRIINIFRKDMKTN
jgi:hypothetical protein